MSELTTLFTNIANSIRDKEGTSETILASDFPNRINNLPSGGGINYNVYVQNEEPVNKTGIWIKTENNVTGFDEITLRERYEYDIFENRLPFSFKTGTVVAGIINDYIYVYDTLSSPCKAYKISSTNYQTTELASPPEALNGAAFAILNKNIYIFGGPGYTGAADTIYKYDPEKNIYTKLSGFFKRDESDLPYEFKQGKAVTIENNIYLIGNKTENHRKDNYKYDVETETLTKMQDIPYDFYGSGNAISIDNDIYILGGEVTGTEFNIYKYDTLTNTYTKINNEKNYNFRYSQSIALNKKIYFFGEKNESQFKPRAYKYDTTKNEFYEIIRMPTQFNGINSGIATDNAIIYIFLNATNTVLNYHLISNIDKENSVILIIDRFKTGEIPISSKINAQILDSYLYKNGEIQNARYYYGDGKKWNLKEGSVTVTE